MATATSDTCCVQQIGETAGDIWKALSLKGPLSLAKLAKEVDAPRDLVMQGVGWLAREGKITVEEEARTRVVALK